MCYRSRARLIIILGLDFFGWFLVYVHMYAIQPLTFNVGVSLESYGEGRRRLNFNEKLLPELYTLENDSSADCEFMFWR